MSLIGHAVAGGGLLFAIYKYREERAEKRKAQEAEKQEAEEAAKWEADAVSTERRVAGAPSPPEGTFDELDEQLHRFVRRSKAIYNWAFRVWNSPQGPRVPVYIKRRGKHNYRVYLPDGSDVLIPVSELAPHPRYPDEEPPDEKA